MCNYVHFSFLGGQAWEDNVPLASLFYFLHWLVYPLRMFFFNILEWCAQCDQDNVVSGVGNGIGQFLSELGL